MHRALSSPCDGDVSAGCIAQVHGERAAIDSPRVFGAKARADPARIDLAPEAQADLAVRQIREDDANRVRSLAVELGNTLAVARLVEHDEELPGLGGPERGGNRSFVEGPAQ